MDSAHRNFLIVAEARSFSAASRSHGISQSALSESISKLEESYGVALFERVSRGVHLTGFGEILLQRVRAIQSEYDQARSEIAAHRDDVMGELRIGCGPRWAINLMPAALARLQQEFTGFHARVVMSHRVQIMEWLDRREIDIGICGVVHPPTSPVIGWNMMSTVHSLIFARSDHPVHDQGEAADLSEWPWTNLHRSPVEQLLPEDMILRMTRRHKVTLTTDSFTVGLRHAALSDNLVIMPEALGHLARAHGLKPVQGKARIRQFRSGIFYHRSIQSRPVIRRLIRIVRDWDEGGLHRELR